jgi:multidrug resistance efflux pump
MDPIVISLAAALAAKMAEDGIGGAWSALVRLVRSHMQAHPSARKALERAQQQPDNRHEIEQLAAELEAMQANDEVFRNEVRRLWPQAELELKNTGVINSITGTVYGGAIQTGTLDVQGNLNLGGTTARNER